MSQNPTIIYTLTDEAPLLATYSFLPIVQAFAKAAGIDIKTSDISLSSRILAAFSDVLPASQKEPDNLAALGALTLQPDANIIKLPNISASIPQLKAAIAELQKLGYQLPDYPEAPTDDASRAIKARYDKVKGSAVNPVLREGNSDRRAPKAVKDYARKHPHKMGEWSQFSKTSVVTMGHDDFYSNEQSVTLPHATTAKITFLPASGAAPIVLLDNLKLQAGEILDATFLSKKALVAFYKDSIQHARDLNVLLSLHLKATMMKVSDPILFGHAVKTYLADFINRNQAALTKIGVDFNNGIGDLVAKLPLLPPAEKSAIEADLRSTLDSQPPLAMVNSHKGITNLHVPSDVIVDASMPAMIREGGKMWNAKGEAQDTLAMIPDSSYASVYQAVVNFCKKNGALDPRTMGSVSNVGLMAQAAEEYGSHNKTFETPADGVVQITDDRGNKLTEHRVEAGDVWRACQTKDAAVRDWVKLAVRRARLSHSPAVFWLDSKRKHDRQLITKIESYLKDSDTSGLDILILAPAAACKYSLERSIRGEDTISVTGNVLRDYLTDLFPILEVGTSAKMLSIVPLMNGGGLFETGAGGSAPKHVQQLLAENYLRWDSLGEFFALAASFEHLAETSGNANARILAETLDEATGRLLDNDKGPSRKLGGIDNRGSHFYIALYWAQALAEQDSNPSLKALFSPLAKQLAAKEQDIMAELSSIQGHAVDVGGYYRPDPSLTSHVMRPSESLNDIISAL